MGARSKTTGKGKRNTRTKPRARARVAQPRATVTLLLRHVASDDHYLENYVQAVQQDQQPVMTRDEYCQRHKIASSDLEKIRAFAREHSLRVVGVDKARRTVELSGTAQDLDGAFGVKLKEYRLAQGPVLSSSAGGEAPGELSGIVAGVVGLDERPFARRIIDAPPPTKKAKAHGKDLTYTPLQIAQAYNFPKEMDGGGQCIAIIELGGGYRHRDLKHYFGKMKVREPKVTAVPVGAKNAPQGPTSTYDGEVTGDIEMVGTLAPGARIVVYFAKNTERGFFNALSTAIHDNRHKPTIISISWGEVESQWPAQTRKLFDQVLQEAAVLGVTVCCASGDAGSSGGVPGGRHVVYPASSPYVLACGGTCLRYQHDTIVEETVWNCSKGASGGGFSRLYPVPQWQGTAVEPVDALQAEKGRGVPDVAGNADPDFGYQILVNGKSTTGAGTSAVAPLWSVAPAWFVASRWSQKAPR